MSAEAQARYQKTDKGRATQARYRKTDKGRRTARRMILAQTTLRREVQLRRLEKELQHR